MEGLFQQELNLYIVNGGFVIAILDYSKACPTIFSSILMIPILIEKNKSITKASQSPIIYPSIYLFSTKKNVLIWFPINAFHPGWNFRQPTGGPPEIKVDGAQGLDRLIVPFSWLL